MIVDKAYPSSEEDLIAFVKKHCDGAESIAVQAGHFLLYYDHTEDLILPGVAEELKSARLAMIREQIGFFPLATWKLGFRILSTMTALEKHVFCVVNDWQYLPDHVDRNDYFVRNPSLFECYKTELDQHAGIKHLKPSKRPNSIASDYFSEQTLRNQYERHIKKLRHRERETSCSGNEGSDLVQCMQNKTEIWCYNKRPNCVHEVAELLFQIEQQISPDVYIGLYPKSCMHFIAQGTELAKSLFNIHMSVINVGLPAVNVNSQTLYEASLVEQYQ